MDGRVALTVQDTVPLIVTGKRELNWASTEEGAAMNAEIAIKRPRKRVLLKEAIRIRTWDFSDFNKIRENWRELVDDRG